MRTLRFFFLPLLLAAALLVAGCGGSIAERSRRRRRGRQRQRRSRRRSSTRSSRRAAQRTRRARPRSRRPAPRSTSRCRTRRCTYLVQQAELAQKAQELGVKVTDKDGRGPARADQEAVLRRRREKYQAQLKAQGLTEPQVRADLRAQILSEALYDKITAPVTVTDGGSRGVLQDARVDVPGRREPRRAPHPRQQQGARRHSSSRS